MLWRHNLYLHVTNKIVSLDSTYIVDVVAWPNFGNSIIYTRESQFYKGLIWKKRVFEGFRWFKFNHLRMMLGMALKFYFSVTKGLKLKDRELWV